MLYETRKGKMKILNYGSLHIDYIYNLPLFAKSGEPVTAQNYECRLGGKGFNQSVAMALAGAEVYHLGKMGNDADALLDIMRKSGVNTDCMSVCQESSGHNVIQRDANGNCNVILHPGANAKITRHEIIETLIEFSSGDWVLLQDEISNVETVINTAHDLGMYVIFNPSSKSGHINKHTLKKVDLFILNLQNAKALSSGKLEDTVLRGLSEKFPDSKFLLTLEKRGAVFFDGKNKIKCSEALYNPEEDGIAEDVYIGYFIAALSSGMSIARALSLAACAVSMIKNENGTETIPQLDINELEHILTNKP